MKKALVFLGLAMLCHGSSFANTVNVDVGDCESFRSSVATNGLNVRFGLKAINVLDAADKLVFSIDASFHQAIDDKCDNYTFRGTDPNFILSVDQSQYPGLYSESFEVLIHSSASQIQMHPQLSQVTVANILFKKGFDTFEGTNGTGYSNIMPSPLSLHSGSIILNMLWGQVSKGGQVYQLVLNSITILNPQ